MLLFEVDDDDDNNDDNNDDDDDDDDGSQYNGKYFDSFFNKLLAIYRLFSFLIFPYQKSWLTIK